MSQTIPSQPRLLVNTIDAKAISIPDSPWILYAKSSSWEQEGGYQTITWKQFADAVNKTAFWLDDNLPQTPRSQTIAYLGPNDPRYYILLVATAKSKRRVCKVFSFLCIYIIN
jgi:acyl-CoA synthetase (AMP-forming)/AMP-acid ligase II